MSNTIIIRLSEQKRLRLQQAAKARGLTVNQLMNQLASEAIAELDAEARFRSRSAQGSAARGLATLAALDRHFARPRRTS